MTKISRTKTKDPPLLRVTPQILAEAVDRLKTRVMFKLYGCGPSEVAFLWLKEERKRARLLTSPHYHIRMLHQAGARTARVTVELTYQVRASPVRSLARHPLSLDHE